jgi:16S rRNA (cytosine1402-N4)-methyltransferase
MEDSSSAHFHSGRRSRGDSSSPAEGLRMRRFSHHEPVLVEAVVELFTPVPSGILVDATVGLGGHAAALLEARPDVVLVGIDRDPEALARAGEVLERFGDRVRLVGGRFGELLRLASEMGVGRGGASGVLFDLGVSSAQLDAPQRGFSYRLEGPLDMRMDPTSGPTAAELLERIGEGELATLLSAHGERQARRLARAILAARPLRTTAELAAVVDRAVPKASRRRGHVARRVFQALRAAVNDEQGELERGLDAAIELLAPGGRLVVIAYHSGDDRIAKHRLLEAARGGCRCLADLPCSCGAVPLGTVLTKKPIVPTAEEVAANPRARAARLRAFERAR